MITLKQFRYVVVQDRMAHTRLYVFVVFVVLFVCLLVGWFLFAGCVLLCSITASVLEHEI